MQGLIPLFAAVFGFLISLILGYPLIPMLRKLKFGQTIRDIGPAWHKSKEGTPTMGGIIIIAGVVISMVLSFMVSSFTGSGLITNQAIQ